MPCHQINTHFDRRDFLDKIMRIGAVTCFASKSCFAIGQEPTQSAIQKHKFLEDSGFSYKDVFRFGIQAIYVPLMKYFMAMNGKDVYLGILQKAYADIWSELMANASRDVSKKNMVTFMESFDRVNKEMTKHMDPVLLPKIAEHMNTIQLVESTDRVLEYTVTECLFAEIYHEADAAEIGYVTHCYSDIVVASAFDPNMKLYRTKTLMQGDDCCNPRYVYEG
ncbi:L-2-amino-thiazoline-4-carboxylic acid hydrolase [bacterium]|nr:L-2-amino-thiazoline-4-carboxylic acid hydrolase [bacterium]